MKKLLKTLVKQGIAVRFGLNSDGCYNATITSPEGAQWGAAGTTLQECLARANYRRLLYPDTRAVPVDSLIGNVHYPAAKVV